MMKRILLIAIMLTCISQLNANNSIMVSRNATDVINTYDAKEKDTIVTTTVDKYREVVSSMEKIGWYVDNIDIDGAGKIVKIKFVDTPPKSTKGVKDGSDYTGIVCDTIDWFGNKVETIILYNHGKEQEDAFWNGHKCKVKVIQEE